MRLGGMESEKLTQALIVGMLIAVSGVGLFFLIYFVLLADADNATRLFTALLVPPAVMAIGFGVYYLTKQSKNK